MSENTLHPFYKAGLGEGPYRFVGCFDMGEAMNPNSAANFGNMRGWVADAPKLEAGLGTCTVCGMGIMIICIVKNAAGKLYGVGSDCIEKCDDNGICKAGVKATLAIRRSRINRARKAAKAKARFEAEAPARELARIEAVARDLAEQRERYAGMERNRPVIEFLYGTDAMTLPGRQLPSGNGWGSEVFLDASGRWMAWNGFRAELLATLLNGTPLHSISERARHILADIKGKNAGRSGSKAYEAAYQQAITLLFPKP